jgi:hypothetical protein
MQNLNGLQNNQDISITPITAEMIELVKKRI